MLVFHLALVNNPQDALVVWTFSSLLYHGTWKEGVKAARELSEGHVNFAPEIFTSFDDIGDEELVQRVSDFASIVLDSVGGLTDSKILRKVMGRYPSSPCPGAVRITLALVYHSCTPHPHYAISMNTHHYSISMN